MPFFYLRNAKDQNVYLLDEPWNFDTSRFPFDKSPRNYKEWWKRANTDGCLLSLTACDFAEGVYGTRVDLKEHLPRVMYGLIADYDHTEIDETYFERLRGGLPRGCSYPPQWGSISQGNHLHLFWLFETPVHFPDLAFAKAFKHFAMEKVRASAFGVTAADYDVKASESLTQYIDIGKQWVAVEPTAVISTNILRSWCMEVASLTLGSRLNRNKKIPLERADELIRKYYPHVELPALKLGMRCRRFWDPAADNDSAACVVDDGFLVFTPHDNGFRTWASLFGDKEIDEIEGDTKGKILENFAYVTGKHANFYHRFSDEDGQEKYEPIEREFVKMILREAGFNGQRSRAGSGNTEVERAMLQIVNNRRVSGAGPYLFFRPGIIRDSSMFPEGGFLNTSTITPHPPAADAAMFTGEQGATWESSEVHAAFPFLYKFLTFLFCHSREEFEKWEASNKTYNGSNNKQLMIFLSWLSHFYKNSYRQSPSVGQALYLVGPPGCGKSFLSTHIIPLLMGGQAAGGEQYFLQGGVFTKEIAERPVITLDDVMPPNEYNARDIATQRIKSFVASGALKYEPKGFDACTIPYRGRLICSSNTTPRDLSVLPSLDSGNRDKFIMLRVGHCNYLSTDAYFLNAQSRQENMRFVCNELGAFARFLLTFEVPRELQDHRYGVIGFQEESLSSAAMERGNAGSVLSCLANWMTATARATPVKHPALSAPIDKKASTDERNKKIAEGIRYNLAMGELPPLRMSSTAVYRALSAFDPFIMKGISANAVQYALTQISSHEAFAPSVQLTQTPAGKHVWSIDYNLLFAYLGDNFEAYDETDISITLSTNN